MSRSPTQRRSSTVNPPVSDPDETPTPLRSAFSGWRLQLSLWTLVATIPTTQDWLYGLLSDGPNLPWWRLWLYHLPLWWLWLPLTPAIQALAHRFPVTRRRGFFALTVHLPAGFVLATAHLALSWLWWRAVGPTQTADGAFTESMIGLLRSSALQTDLFAYWAVLAVVSSQEVYREVLSREEENSRLRYRLAQARIRALKTQLQPHFMFNALNAVSTLVIRKDGSSAGRMLGQLAEFVRLTLSDSGQEIALADDVALAEKYLSIEQVRFEDRLRFTVEVDPEAARALVPQLLLQPVVENAVRHGISPKAEGGHIEIRASRHEDRIRIEVSDDGAGLPGARPSIRRRTDGGIGLSNTRDRLQHLYGDDFGFELSGARGEGTRVFFDLPFRSGTSSSEEQAPSAKADPTDPIAEEDGSDV